jgi:hypothetical protein
MDVGESFVLEAVGGFLLYHCLDIWPFWWISGVGQ